MADGQPAVDVARELAVAVLRTAPAGSALWERALAVVEGRAERREDAVLLAASVIEAAGRAESRS